MVNEERDLYNKQRRFDRAKEKLMKVNIPNSNKKLIDDFINCCLAENLDKSRIAKQIYELIHLSEWLGKDFKKAKRNDLEKVVTKINQLDNAPKTKKDYRGILKRFYRWLYSVKLKKFEWNGDNRNFPPIVYWISNKIKERERNTGLKGSLLKEEDILKVINVAKNPRNKALAFLLWESGMRSGEILNLRLKDVQQNEYGYEINIPYGKTSARKITVIQCAKDLSNYLNYHEDKDNPQAFLFDIRYRRFKDIIENLCDKAGINGKMKNPHSWRKARATYLCSHMTTNQLMAYFGWNDPKTSRSYIFASQDIILSAILKLNNKDYKKKGSELKPKTCVRCGEENSVGNRFCSKCSMPLTEDAINLIENETIKTAKKMGKFESKLKTHEISIFQRAMNPKATKQDINNLAKLIVHVRGNTKT